MNILSSLSFSLCKRCSSSLTTFMALCCTQSIMSMSLLYLGAQHWIQHAKCVSLDLPALLFLMQPRRLLAAFVVGAHCCLMVSLLSIRTFQGLLSSLSALSVYWCLDLFLPRCRTLHFPLYSCMKFLSAHFSSLFRFP